MDNSRSRPTSIFHPFAFAVKSAWHVILASVLLACLSTAGHQELHAATAAADVFAEGYRHLTGQGVPQDATLAARFFLEAAQAGEPQAQYQLGLMHMDGLGVPKDILWGYFWLERACSGPGLPEDFLQQTRGRMDVLQRELTADQKRRLGIREGSTPDSAHP
jgi:hypothetical protein